jgi:hypothetical protein
MHNDYIRTSWPPSPDHKRGHNTVALDATSAWDAKGSIPRPSNDIFSVDLKLKRTISDQKASFLRPLPLLNDLCPRPPTTDLTSADDAQVRIGGHAFPLPFLIRILSQSCRCVIDTSLLRRAPYAVTQSSPKSDKSIVKIPNAIIALSILPTVLPDLDVLAVGVADIIRTSHALTSHLTFPTHVSSLRQPTRTRY